MQTYVAVFQLATELHLLRSIQLHVHDNKNEVNSITLTIHGLMVAITAEIAPSKRTSPKTTNSLRPFVSCHPSSFLAVQASYLSSAQRYPPNRKLQPI
jgi:hypothetical protein